jgi:hypothetical protein
MAQRQHKATSKAAHESIKPCKNFYHEKIIAGLQKLKVGGNYEQVAMASEIRPDQAWRRLSELVKAGKVYDTGITRKLSSGRSGVVWQLVGLEYVDPGNPKTDNEIRDLKRAGITPEIHEYMKESTQRIIDKHTAYQQSELFQ